MDYRISPFCDIWNDGIFNVPNILVDRYIKLASEYQLKALLLVLRNGGQSSSSYIAKALGQTVRDVEALMEFWTDEGVLSSGDAQSDHSVTEQKKEHIGKPEEKRETKEMLSPTRLSPKDIVTLSREDERIQFLLCEAQKVLGRTISHAEQEMLVNMVGYYGLKVEIILMILEFYRSEREKGRSIGISYVNAMAKNWSDEGIETIDEAEEKLESIARSNRLWNEIVSITGIRHRRPTAKQREMVEAWFCDFDITMITLAADIMKENTSEPKLTYMNTVLKKWKKKGITSPLEVKREQEEFAKQKEDKKESRLKGTPSYDLEEIKRAAMHNTEI